MALVILAAAAPATAEIRGVVFVDADADGRRDPGEAPRAGVRVSNGRQVQITGADGRYGFAAAPEGFVWITRPDDFECADWYRSASGDFALVPAPFPDDFFFVHLSDVHAYENPVDFARYSLADRPWWMPERLGAFALSWIMAGGYGRPRSEILEGFRRALAPYRDVSEISGSRILTAYLEEFERPGSPLGRVRDRIREALTEVAALRPAFAINTGDLMMEGNSAPPQRVDAWLSLYRKLSRATGIPFYETIGNNEIAGSARDDFPVGDPLYGKGAFRRFFGPTWYSFDRGPFHFVALDAHRRRDRAGLRPDWSFDELAPELLEWLDADLEAHAGRVLVALNHEPFHKLPGWRLFTRVDDRGRFARHGVTYSLAGHIHQNGVEQIGGTTHVTTGALSGLRWAPPPEVHPRGYRLFYAAGGRLYSAWKETGKPVLGFVHPRGDPALFASGGPEPRQDGRLEVVAVATDSAGALARLELHLDGQALAAEAWGDYFLRALVPAEASGGELRLRGVTAEGRVLEARLSLPAD